MRMLSFLASKGGKSELDPDFSSTLQPKLNVRDLRTKKKSRIPKLTAKQQKASDDGNGCRINSLSNPKNRQSDSCRMLESSAFHVCAFVRHFVVLTTIHHQTTTNQPYSSVE